MNSHQTERAQRSAGIFYVIGFVLLILASLAWHFKGNLALYFYTSPPLYAAKNFDVTGILMRNRAYFQKEQSFICKNKKWICYEEDPGCKARINTSKWTPEEQACAPKLGLIERELGLGRYCYRATGSKLKAKLWVVYTDNRSCEYAPQSIVTTLELFDESPEYRRREYKVPTGKHNPPSPPKPH